MPAKIIVGLDGSKQSFKALKKAIEWTKKVKGKLLIVSVAMFPFAEASHDIYVPGADVTLDYFTRLHYNALKQARKSRVKAESHILRGLPQEAMVRLAKKVKAELIVLGRHGQGVEESMESFVLGSVTSDVSRKAPCNVLIVG